MTELLTAAQMREIEQAAIASGEVTGLELMERAGRGVVEAVFAEWPELRAGTFRAVVLCGPGNNGGDGFVVARLLKEWGWVVEVFLYGTPERMPPDARVNYDRWLAMGEVRGLDIRPDTWEVTLIVDALFGTGLTRGIEGPFRKVFFDLALHRHGDQHVCAVDCPSGICLDSGRLLSEDVSSAPVLQADLTVTFAARKIGHLLDAGPEICGKVVVADIGLPFWGVGRRALAALYNLAPPGLGLNRFVLFESEPNPAVRDKRAGHPAAHPAAHKYSHGHALIVSGDHGRAGAARLAARGALRIGAGLVTVASPPGAMAENAARLDAVMLRAVADGDAFGRVLQDRRINALCLGPGMGVRAREAEFLAAALAGPPPPSPPHEGEGGRLGPGTAQGGQALPLPRAGRGEGRGVRAVVLDADALTLLARDAALFALLHGGCVLTPHGGEFARLFPDIAEKLAAPATRGPAYSKVDATRAAAARAGCVVLYKGADTVIADPSGRCAINAAVYDRAAPWLATAGSGDVLAGFITGLLARGFSPFDAACTAAWLHVECARSFGPGLIAEDLPEELPKVFRALGL